MFFLEIPYLFKFCLCQRVPVSPESSPPYCSPTRILTPLYFQSKQNPLESLLKFLRSITALCLDSESTRTSLPDSLQDGDTNRVYFFAIRNFYEDLSVFLENLCCVFDSDHRPAFPSPRHFHLGVLHGYVEFISGLNSVTQLSVDGFHASMLPILFGSMATGYRQGLW